MFVDRLTRAIGEVRPLLAQRGCTVAPGLRLRTLAEVIDHPEAGGQTAITDGTQIPSDAQQQAARTGTHSSPARPSGTP
ncbi:hypothetical protein ACH4GM_41545 [Streptomyces coeruleorubidus]|uniref:hypothetical protein n=1 Tax=Streptomyces coeruleorubidus TaxID=116188 RepID=UPI00379880D2